MMLDLDDPPAPLARLLESAEENGCVNLSELDALARRFDVDDDDLPALHDAFGTRGIDVTDDCGRSDVRRPTPATAAWPAATTDAARPVPQRDRRHPLLTASEEVELSKRIEQGDAAAKERMINSNLATRRLDREEVPAEELPLLDLIRRASSA